MLAGPSENSSMDPIAALLLTITVPIVAGISAVLWRRAADLADELRAFDVEGIHFER
jgi:hypothetical protein